MFFPGFRHLRTCSNAISGATIRNPHRARSHRRSVRTATGGACERETMVGPDRDRFQVAVRILWACVVSGKRSFRGGGLYGRPHVSYGWSGGLDSIDVPGSIWWGSRLSEKRRGRLVAVTALPNGQRAAPSTREGTSMHDTRGFFVG